MKLSVTSGWLFRLFCQLGLICLGWKKASCQVVPDSVQVSRDSSVNVRKVDAFDIARDVLGYLHIRKKKDMENEPEDQDTIVRNIFSFFPVLKYAPATRLASGVLLNVSFYTGSARHTSLSAIQSQINYTLNRQFIVKTKSVIWSKGNHYNFSGDWRYLQYPSYTYGLGSDTREDQKVLIDYSWFRFHQLFYRKFRKYFLAGIGYNLDYRYRISQLDPHPETDLLKYQGGPASSVSSGPAVSMLYDSRINPNNPVKGAYFVNLLYRCNFMETGSTTAWNSFIAEGRKYVSLPALSDNILAFWTYNWFTFGDVPYLDLPSNYMDHYENQGRGYIQGRYRSRDLVSFETEYRFTITRNRFLGGVVFSNVHSVSNWQTRHFDSFYPAAGAGIRIKVNKYTNTNVAADFAIGIDGSKGIFFNLGEVF